MLDRRQGEEPFVLSKWYLDCVTDAGDVFVGYAARLGFRGVELGYSGVLNGGERGGTRTATSLRHFSEPRRHGSALLWSATSLGVRGLWASDARPVERRLLEQDGGVLDWSCLQPRARVAVRGRRGKAWKGLGYAENVRMTIRPWRLPIDELRWGRFVSAEETLVWIDWRGPRPLTLLFRNGEQLQGARVGDSGVTAEADGTVLELNGHDTLRVGRLVSTALSRVLPLRKLLPEKILNAHECKWRSRGVLKRGRERVAEGWAIHEVVRWTK